jgi:hypothetical protein
MLILLFSFALQPGTPEAKAKYKGEAASPGVACKN